MIDPVDGSTNAHRGVPFYSTSICVLDAEGPRVGLVVNQATGDPLRRRARCGAPSATVAPIAPSGCAGPRRGHRRHLGVPRPPPGLGAVPGARRGVARVLRRRRGRARRLPGGGAEHALRLGLPGRPAHLPRGRRGRRTSATAGTSSCGTTPSRRPIVAATAALAGRLPEEETCDRQTTDRRDGALLARKTWRTLEPLHGMIYFVPEAAEAYAASGITGRAGTSRRGPPRWARCGPRSWSRRSSTSTPSWCARRSRRAWDLAARSSWSRRASPRSTPPSGASWATRSSASAEMAPGRRAGPHGGRGGVPSTPRAARWPPRTPTSPGPSEPHLVLWHAQSILREYRGDGHIALLVVHGLSGIEALVTHAAAGDVPAHLLRSTRGWPRRHWRRRSTALRARGWLEPGRRAPLHRVGRSPAPGRSRTAPTRWPPPPTCALGEERCAELRALARPWSKAFAEHLR